MICVSERVGDTFDPLSPDKKRDRNDGMKISMKVFVCRGSSLIQSRKRMRIRGYEARKMNALLIQYVGKKAKMVERV